MDGAMRRLLLVLALLLLPLYPCSAVVYVRSDALPGGNGKSWATAFNDIQPAVDRAAKIRQDVWVAAGQYGSAGDGHPIDVPRVNLKPGVRIYGGFAGTGRNPSHRDWVRYRTVIGGDEYDSLVLAEDRAVLDGFVITGGWTGIACAGSASISNCLITGCGNRFSSGAGISCGGPSSVVRVTNCRLDGNAAGAEGGGIYCEGGRLIIERCVLSANHSGAYVSNFGGGAICVVADLDGGGPADVLIRDSIFSGNECSTAGGGIFAQASVVRAENCRFLDNSSDDDGGAIYAWDYSDVCLINCVIAGNTSFSSGGGIATFWETNATLINCTAYGNSAVSGGFSLCFEDSRQDWYNTIVSGNRALVTGGAADADYWNSEIVASHCDIWDNGPAPFAPASADPVGTSGNISADPLLADPEGGDFHLTKRSPCINAGTGIVPFLPKTDFEGDPRSRPLGQKLRPDIGADEYMPGRGR